MNGPTYAIRLTKFVIGRGAFRVWIEVRLGRREDDSKTAPWVEPMRSNQLNEHMIARRGRGDTTGDMGVNTGWLVLWKRKDAKAQGRKGV